MPAATSPDTGRFLWLPAAVLVHGFVHTRGRSAGHPRLEAAVLSVMAWLWGRSRGHAETLPYHDGITVEIREDEFVASIYGVARVLWARFYRQPVPTVGLGARVFGSFYEVVRLAVSRLRSTVVGSAPLLQRLGPARPDILTKASDAYGQRWTMAGSVVDQWMDWHETETGVSAETARPETPNVLFYDDLDVVYKTFSTWNAERAEEHDGKTCALGSRIHSLCDDNYVQESFTGGPLLVNVAGVYDALFARQMSLHDAAVEVAAKSRGLGQAERSANGLAWQRRLIHRHDRGSAHVSVGAWRRDDATAPMRRDMPCTVPFLVADVDAPTLECALVVVRLLLGRLVALGACAEDLVVSYTGGRGYHVRIPHGLVGRPLWPRAADVSRVLTHFFAQLCDGLATPDGPLVDSLDAALFSPLHLVRAVGSEHERYPGRWCVGYRGGDFLRLVDTLGDGVLDVVEAHSRSPELVSFSLPNPDRMSAVPALEEMLRASVKDARAAAVKTDRLTKGASASRGIVAAIRPGVSPGEEFAPGHVGRNRAALIYAVYLLTNCRLSEAAVWAELARWNAEANPVPIGEAEDDTDSELVRVFDRAYQFVKGQSWIKIPRAS
jgi:hypothetical protein